LNSKTGDFQQVTWAVVYCSPRPQWARGGKHGRAGDVIIKIVGDGHTIAKEKASAEIKKYKDRIRHEARDCTRTNSP
jgi:hypothetical protein